jgi:hypothetical protein
MMPTYLASQSQQEIEYSVCMGSFNRLAAPWLDLGYHCGHDAKTSSRYMTLPRLGVQTGVINGGPLHPHS